MDEPRPPEPVARPVPANRRAWSIVIPAALALVVFDRTGSVHASKAQEPRPGGAPATAAARRASTRALGRLEPASGLVVVGARPGTRVETVEVREGQEVKKGEKLAVLEGHQQAGQQLALAKAQKAQAEHHRTLRREKLDLERKASGLTRKAQLKAAREAAGAVKKRYDAARPLYESFASTLKGKEKYDAETSYLTLETQVTQTALNQALLEIAEAMIPDREALEDRELAADSPDLAVLDRQVELAQTALDQTVVLAPAPGRILEMKTHPGEVSSGALLTLGDTSAMAATAEVFQTDVPRVAVGDPAEVRVLDRTVGGRVTAIASVVGKNRLASLDPRDLQDRRVVAVTVRLDDPATAARFVNMEVDVLITPSGPADGPGGR